MVKLTQKEEEAVIKLMNVIWQEIGNDLLECSGGSSVSGATLRDVALDQIHSRMMLHDMNIRHIDADWAVIKEKWYQLTPSKRLGIAKKAFPGRSYC